jgi:hypothetical protein
MIPVSNRDFFCPGLAQSLPDQLSDNDKKYYVNLTHYCFYYGEKTEENPE